MKKVFFLAFFLCFIVSSYVYSADVSSLDIRGIKLGMSYDNLQKKFPDAKVSKMEYSLGSLDGIGIYYSYKVLFDNNSGFLVGLNKDKKVIYVSLSKEENFINKNFPVKFSKLNSDLIAKYGKPDYYGSGLRKERDKDPNDINVWTNKYERKTWSWGNYKLVGRYKDIAIIDNDGPATQYIDRGKVLHVDLTDFISGRSYGQNKMTLHFYLLDMDQIKKEQVFLNNKSLNF